jgi:hypothetical protein
VVAGTAAVLMCHICKHSPKLDAQQVSCCRYSFCKACLFQSGQRGSVVRCPLCQTPDAGVSKDRTYEVTLQLVHVRCKDAPCCAWQGPYTAAERHEEACEVRSRSSLPSPHNSHISYASIRPTFLHQSLICICPPLRLSCEVGKLRMELRLKEDELKESSVKVLHHVWVVVELSRSPIIPPPPLMG